MELKPLNIHSAMMDPPTMRASSLDSASPELREAAEGFEAVFLHTLLKQMRASSDVLAPEDSPFSTANQGVFRDLYDQHMGKVMADRSSLGIAEMLAKQLGGQNRTSVDAALDELKVSQIGLNTSVLSPLNGTDL